MSDEAKIILKDMQIEEMRKEIISQDQFIAQLEKEYDKELQQKENIIKKVREKVEKLAKLYDDNYTISDKGKDILEILDKVEE